MSPSESLEERFLGSTDLHLLRKCPCPVWIDRPGKMIPYRKILAAIDPMSDEGAAIKIMQLATSLADRESARVGIPGFIIGNTAEDVLQSSESSILAVKPDGYVSPLT